MRQYTTEQKMKIYEAAIQAIQREGGNFVDALMECMPPYRFAVAVAYDEEDLLDADTAAHAKLLLADYTKEV